MTEERTVTAGDRDISAQAFEDVFLYVPETGQIVQISEGAGTNLTDEDIREGYVDYINYSQYDLSDGIQEADGGMVLSKEYIRRRYKKLADCAGDVIELAYGRRDMAFIRLEKRGGGTVKKEEAMGIEEFEETLVGLLKEKFGTAAEISIKEVLKNNGIRKRGILINMEGEHFSPILYLEDAYERYKECEDVEEVFVEFLDINDAQMRKMDETGDLNLEQLEDYDHVKEHLRLMLINGGKNEELLQNRPHIVWNDLAAVFYYDIGDGEACALIDNGQLAQWGKTEKDLYEDAVSNMQCGAEDKMFHLSELLGMGEELPVHVLTNRMRRYGAAAALYSPKIRKLADETGSDLVILPSSLHEVLLVPDTKEKREEFRKLVGDVNRMALKPEEVLSDNIYLYSRERDAVELLQAG